MADQDTSAQSAGIEEDERERAERIRREDEAELAELKRKYGSRIAVFKDDDFGRLVISPRGKRKEYQALVNAMSDPKQDSAVAQEQFALDCVVEPTKAEAKRIFADFPALASLAGSRAMELCGLAVKELGKA